MTVSAREKRLLLLAVPALLVAFILYNTLSGDSVTAVTEADTMSTPMAERRAALLRKAVATVPAREAVMRQTSADLTDRERGIIAAETSAQAQATLVEVARRVGKVEQIDVRSSDFPQPKTFGDYGLVYATVTFDCHIDQLINFLASLSHQPELVVPSDERINSANPKEKTMNVRITLAGVVNKKLIPVKKGLGAF